MAAAVATRTPAAASRPSRRQAKAASSSVRSVRLGWPSRYVLWIRAMMQSEGAP